VEARLSSELNDAIWNNPVDIFIPAAASRLVQKNQVEQLIKNGLQVIACGANVPFADKEIFVGPIAAYADKKVSLIPDFIANCGMARVFAYLMSNPDDMSDKGIFSDVDKTIEVALQKIFERNDKNTGITATGFDIALEQLI
jgi:glutamate dehydrogenase/leucine dehydrogenase